MIKHLIVGLLCVTTFASGPGLFPASGGESCTAVKTSTPSGSFVGQICVDSETQLVHIDGALAVKGHTYRVEATGAMTIEKVDGNPVYTISGEETIVYPGASTLA